MKTVGLYPLIQYTTCVTSSNFTKSPLPSPGCHSFLPYETAVRYYGSTQTRKSQDEDRQDATEPQQNEDGGREPEP
jgi:hypothetical protein